MRNGQRRVANAQSLAHNRSEQDNFALGKYLTDQSQFVPIEIAKAAVDEFTRTRQGAIGRISLPEQQHGHATACRIPCDPGTVHATADDKEFE